MSLLSNQAHGEQLRQELFARDYDPIEMQRLRAVLGDADRFGPRVVRNSAEIMDEYPHYRALWSDTPSRRAFCERYLDAIAPVLQGPFPLPGKASINGPWSGHYKVESFPACGVTAEFVKGKRIIDVGCNAGFDSFYLAALGAAEVVGIEPSAFCYQARFLAAAYDCPNVRFVKCGWQAVTTEGFGTFDIVNCQGILYHEPDMLALLQALVRMLAPGGMLVLETHVILQRTMSARFVEGDFWGDPNWWWLPDLDTTEAMLRAVGLSAVRNVKSNPVPSKNPASETLTVEGQPAGGRAYFTAVKEGASPATKPQ